MPSASPINEKSEKSSDGVNKREGFMPLWQPIFSNKQEWCFLYLETMRYTVGTIMSCISGTSIRLSKIFRRLRSKVLPNDPTQISGILPLHSIRRILVTLTGGDASESLEKLREHLDSRNSSLSERASVYQYVLTKYTWESMRKILPTVDAEDVGLDSRYAFQLVSGNNDHKVHYPIGDCVICHSMGKAIWVLWQDPVIRRSARELQYKVPGLEVDSADYIFDSLLQMSEDRRESPLTMLDRLSPDPPHPKGKAKWC